MSDALSAFLERVFQDGAAHLRERPAARSDDAVPAVLEREHAARSLDVAGPPLAFDPVAATTAARLLHWACWCLVRQEEKLDAIEGLATALDAREAPAARHFSTDLSLRFLPQVHRRSRALEAGGRLPALLGSVLGRWPLSGVLSDVTGAPADVRFAGHPGLVLLYEERLATKRKHAHD
jgi:hypothetical protein